MTNEGLVKEIPDTSAIFEPHVLSAIPYVLAFISAVMLGAEQHSHGFRTLGAYSIKYLGTQKRSSDSDYIFPLSI